MAELQRRTGQFDTAMNYIDHAITMKKAIYGAEDHPSIAEAVGVQAKIYDHLGEFDREEKIWERVLEIQRQDITTIDGFLGLQTMAGQEK